MEQLKIKYHFTYVSSGNLIRNFDANNNKAMKGDIAGNIRKDGYITVKVETKRYYLHRLIWIYHNGEIPKNMQIDHIDGNPSNNKIENLQVLNNRNNTLKGNRKKKGKVPFIGVVLTKENNYQASIRNNGRRECLGTFSTPEDAAKAYDKRAFEINGSYATLNNITC